MRLAIWRASAMRPPLVLSPDDPAPDLAMANNFNYAIDPGGLAHSPVDAAQSPLLGVPEPRFGRSAADAAPKRAAPAQASPWEASDVRISIRCRASSACRAGARAHSINSSQPKPDRIATASEDNRNCRGYRLSGQRPWCKGNKCGYSSVDEVCR
jgi:hypothetical protein